MAQRVADLSKSFVAHLDRFERRSLFTSLVAYAAPNRSVGCKAGEKSIPSLELVRRYDLGRNGGVSLRPSYRRKPDPFALRCGNGS